MTLLSIMVLGEEKSGKTHMAGTLFNSQLIRPDRILYLDTHESTKALRVPQSQIRHIATLDEAVKQVDRVLAAGARGKAPPCDVIVIDDFSDLTERDITEELDGKENARARQRAWGELRDALFPFLWKIQPKSTRAHLFCISRAFRMTIPTSAKVKDEKGNEKERPTAIRPFVRGQTGPWANYQFDIIAYSERRVRGDDMGFFLHLWPLGDVEVAHRWFEEQLADRELARRLDNPSFDQLVAWVEQASRVELPGKPTVPITIERRRVAEEVKHEHGADAGVPASGAAPDTAS